MFGKGSEYFSGLAAYEVAVGGEGGDLFADHYTIAIVSLFVEEKFNGKPIIIELEALFEQPGDAIGRKSLSFFEH